MRPGIEDGATAATMPRATIAIATGRVDPGNRWQQLLCATTSTATTAIQVTLITPSASKITMSATVEPDTVESPELESGTDVGTAAPTTVAVRHTVVFRAETPR
jgi:hypothetical protein